MIAIWTQFALCAALIGAAGIYVSRYGDVIADKTGVSRGWIGLVLMATVTSLPELVTGVSSVTVANTPDIALGDVLGSCVFNLALIGVVDLLCRNESVYRRAGRGHVLSGGFGVILIAITVLGVLLSSLGLPLPVGHVGLVALALIPVYVIAMGAVYRFERDAIAEFEEESAALYPDVTLQQAVLRYVAGAVVVVAAGSALPFVAERLSEAMHWRQSFVGNLFVAFATSLPETVVTIAAVRLGAVDMAVGNLLGSNLFNMVIVSIDDLFFVKGPLFASTSPTHAISGLSALVMTGAVIAGLMTRTHTRIVRTVGWPSLALLLLYWFNAYALYRLGR